MTHEQIDPIVAQLQSCIELMQTLISQFSSLIVEAPAAVTPPAAEAPAPEAAPVAPEAPAPAAAPLNVDEAGNPVG
jgi:hypothetical protein